MDEKRDYTPNARAADESQALLPQFSSDLKSSAPQSAPAAAVNAPTPLSPAALDAENRRADFTQRLVPGYIPVITTDEAMGHLTPPPRSNGSSVMMTVLAGVALLWFMLTATGGVEFGANRMGDMRQEAASGSPAETMAGKRLVPLEAHVMSKCPDTKACYRDPVDVCHA